MLVILSEKLQYKIIIYFKKYVMMLLKQGIRNKIQILDISFLLTVRRTAAIQERVTAVLLTIPKEAFADSFQKLYERYQQCVVT
jgi:hypothetical protein